MDHTSDTGVDVHGETEEDREGGGCKLRLRRMDPTNAAHLYGCPWVGDGKGRTRELAMKAERSCEEVARFVS